MVFEPEFQKIVCSLFGALREVRACKMGPSAFFSHTDPQDRGIRQSISLSDCHADFQRGIGHQEVVRSSGSSTSGKIEAKQAPVVANFATLWLFSNIGPFVMSSNVS